MAYLGEAILLAVLVSGALISTIDNRSGCASQLSEDNQHQAIPSLFCPAGIPCISADDLCKKDR